MKWRNIPPILLIAVPWLIMLPILCQSLVPYETGGFLNSFILLPALVCFPVLLILNLFCALLVRWDTAELALWNYRIKLYLIPFYLFTVIFCIGVPLGILFLVPIDALLMVSTSTYGLRALIRARKEQQFGKGMFLILFLCHFCFVADVIAAFALHRKLKVKPIAQNL